MKAKNALILALAVGTIIPPSNALAYEEIHEDSYVVQIFQDEEDIDLYKDYIRDDKDISMWKAEENLLFLGDDSFDTYINREEDAIEDEIFDQREEDFRDLEFYPNEESYEDTIDYEHLPGHIDVPGDGFNMGMSSDLSDYEIAELPTTYKFDGANKSLKTLRISERSNHREYMDVVNLKAYAEAAAGTGLNFDIVKEAYIDYTEKVFIEKGKDYTGSASVAYDNSKLRRSDLYPGVYPDIIHRDDLNSTRITIVVGGEEREIRAFVVGGELYIDPAELNLALKNRQHVSMDTNSEIEIYSDESDIYVPTVEEVKDEFAKADYTLVHIWNPGLEWSRSSTYDIEAYKKVLDARSELIQVVGFVDESYNYKMDEVNELFKNTDYNELSYPNFGINENIAAYLRELNGGAYDGLPAIFVVDKNGNRIGYDFHHYFNAYAKKEAQSRGMTNSNFRDAYFGEGDDLDYGMYNLIKSNVYKDFFDLALADGEIPVEKTLYNKDLQNADVVYNINGRKSKIRSLDYKTNLKTGYENSKLVNLRDLAAKMRDTDLKFNFEISYDFINDNGPTEISVKMGENYDGHRASSKRNYELRGLDKNLKVINLKVGDKAYDIYYMNVYDDPYVYPEQFLKALGANVKADGNEVVISSPKKNSNIIPDKDPIKPKNDEIVANTKIKVPAKAVEAPKTTNSNPQTGVGSISGFLGIGTLASIILRKTKKY